MSRLVRKVCIDCCLKIKRSKTKQSTYVTSLTKDTQGTTNEPFHCSEWFSRFECLYFPVSQLLQVRYLIPEIQSYFASSGNSIECSIKTVLYGFMLRLKCDMLKDKFFWKYWISWQDSFPFVILIFMFQALIVLWVEEKHV